MKELLDESTVRAFKSGNCFDFIRYFFAFSLFVVHFCTICDIDQFWFVSGGTRVKAFFTLSGFLVFYSLASKRDLRGYIDKRLRRILPAYTAAVLLCLFVGAVFTTLPLGRFFSEGATWKYLAANLCFLNFLQPTLPGVFESNPLPFLNGSLWSMKVEVFFYVTAPVVYYLMTRFNKHAVLLLVYAVCFAYNAWFDHLYALTGDARYFHLRVQVGSFIYFYAGVILLVYFRHFMRLRRYVLPLAAVLYFTREWVEPFCWVESLTFACLLVGFAYGVRPLNFLRRFDNVSYGIYLYHFPLIQAAVCMGWAARSMALTFVGCLVATVLLATLSWYGLEKPVLRQRWIVPRRPQQAPEALQSVKK